MARPTDPKNPNLPTPGNRASEDRDIIPPHPPGGVHNEKRNGEKPLKDTETVDLTWTYDKVIITLEKIDDNLH